MVGPGKGVYAVGCSGLEKYSIFHVFYLRGKVTLEFLDTLAPVGSCLLTDQFYIEEGTLTWPISVT